MVLTSSPNYSHLLQQILLRAGEKSLRAGKWRAEENILVGSGKIFTNMRRSENRE